MSVYFPAKWNQDGDSVKVHFEIDCGKLTQFLGATLADLATKGKRLQLPEIQQAFVDIFQASIADKINKIVEQKQGCG